MVATVVLPMVVIMAPLIMLGMTLPSVVVLAVIVPVVVVRGGHEEYQNDGSCRKV
jgi:hypothetical protein